MPKLKRALLDRLPRYYRCVREFIQHNEGHAIASSQIADFIDMDDTQVRKDLASIGVRGIPRVGFDAKDVLGRIHDILGFDMQFRTVIVGAGRLGGAIACYPGFKHYGMDLVAMFDASAERIGGNVNGVLIEDVANLEQRVAALEAQLAVLTVPEQAAQGIADQLVKAGIQALWNFTPAKLHVPVTMPLRDEHLSVGLAELSYGMKYRLEQR